MSGSLGPGSTFAGCRLEAVAGRGGMGVVYRGTQLGLVHRDSKPGNVLIAPCDDEREEDVYLTDFGIARRSASQSGMTSTGMLVGTVDYMAPERISGGKGDAASDIYSFGCMLFEALSGQLPFDRPTNVAKVFAHVNDP